MPILQIEVVLAAGEPAAASAAAYAQAAASVLGSRPGGTWVRLRQLEAGSYAEDAGGPPPGVFPVFVEVLLAEHPPQAELVNLAEKLAAAIAEVCGRPSANVHVFFEPPGRGRVGFGGKLLPSQEE